MLLILLLDNLKSNFFFKSEGLCMSVLFKIKNTNFTLLNAVHLVRTHCSQTLQEILIFLQTSLSYNQTDFSTDI